jgi:hypothetical protein
MNPKFVHAGKVVLFYCVLYALFFSPVLFAGRLLAPGDALSLYLPSFLSPFTLWEPNLQGGFPVAADLQTATWYLPARLFGLFNSWNSFVLSAFVLTSCFSYAYIYSLTRSWIGSLVAGIIAGMNGFLVAHLGHTIVIHGFVWTPLLLLSIEKIAVQPRRIWIVIGAFAIAFALLSGHPQIPAYGLAVAGVYALLRFFLMNHSRGLYLISCFGMLLLGVGLTAIQMVPLFELVSLSVRDQPTFTFFHTYSVPPLQLSTFFFPLIFGTNPSAALSYRYFGAWNFTEMACYVGLLSLLLAFVGVRSKPRAIIVFWSVIAVLALFLALGGITPLASLMYQIPGIKSFRAPARHISEMTLAVSFLAGFGATLIHKTEVRLRAAIISIVLVSVLFIAAATVLVFHSDRIRQMAESHGISSFALIPWKNLAVTAPVLFFTMGAAALIAIVVKQNRWTIAFLFLVLISDLAFFGYFNEWTSSPHRKALVASKDLAEIGRRLRASNQRLMPVYGVRSSLEEGRPNLTRLWDIPSASGYGSLILKRLNEFLGMPPDGGLYSDWAVNENRALDLMAVRYISWNSNTHTMSSRVVSSRIPWSIDNLDIQVGNRCGSIQMKSIDIQLPIAFETSSIGIVSSLSCALTIKQAEPVAQIALSDAAHQRDVVHLLAGIDTAEWSYDCYRQGKIAHARPSVLKTAVPMQNKKRNCDGLMFVSTLPLQSLLPVRKLKLRWTGNDGLLAIQKITLINGRTNKKFPLSLNSLHLSDSRRWKRVEAVKSAILFENQRAMPHAWLAYNVIHLPKDQILKTILTSRLPNGKLFKARESALLEEDLNISGKRNVSDTVKVIDHRNTNLKLEANTSGPALLVMSDIFYPGWKATVNGRIVPIYQTNYLFRGVPVPGGLSKVELKYEPKTFQIGSGITLTSAILIACLLLIPNRLANKFKRELSDVA